ncbi:uncharacterized protein LOC106653403 [Trichogramma pretiosum]|uniref:uncharacterized protein LOC106653403 n=1 Tax=Trichogramma pretiosum TaxID=7493 RepID=UPI0006C985E1|nr:uncharacterized protein LOC106653403 [Trichogramma pretiosum]XP_014228302.1 uncharacterized protein LOC106653403 [Trichogramma pretiosum]XP_014228303.1 uncharacterized protein LOC106653403 [Trichogramma pretiosum]XP_023314331.1 uncharacterized protein LOC106653403 [Trichogramma pretiosum]
MAMAKLKNFIDTSLKTVSQPIERATGGPLEPEVGLRIVHSADEKNLRVTVLGARHLPQNFGLTRVNSYIVKVKLLPGKEKFETTARNESWPQWNEEFCFPLRKETKAKKFGKTKVVEEEIGASKIIVATLYAVLEDKPLIATEKKENDKDNKAKESKSLFPVKGGKKEIGGSSSAQIQEQKELNQHQSLNSRGTKLLSQIFGNKSSDKISSGEDNTSSSTKSGSTGLTRYQEQRKAFAQRRTIGATSVPLDPRNFTSKPAKAKHPSDVSTGDMWRTLKPISSGISGAEERRENKKGQVEISLLQEKSGDKKDGESAGRLVLTLMRLRCSLQSMHEHEALKGQMYIKMSVVDAGRVTHFWKSDRFAPSVSMKFDDKQAQVAAENPYAGALKDVSFVVKFVSKNKIGKKVTVGHFVIGPEVGGTYGEQWKQALAKPGHAVVKWQPFE